MRKISRLLVAIALTTALAPAHAATLVIDGGKLMGAKGVDVAGTLYDVAFLDGTCAQVFGACSQNNFAFTNENNAEAAAQALFSQVFLDTEYFKFNTTPSLTFGCNNTIQCTSIIPHANNSSMFFSIGAVNRDLTDGWPTISGTFEFDTSPLRTYNFAKFTLAAVPEPATWGMMILGFSLLGGAMRRRTSARPAVTYA